MKDQAVTKLLFQTNHFSETSDEAKYDIQNKKIRLIHIAIAKLTKVENVIVKLYLDGKSNQEIAEIAEIIFYKHHFNSLNDKGC
jgi:DNA-binding NarL/FixJ family response regulator